MQFWDHIAKSLNNSHFMYLLTVQKNKGQDKKDFLIHDTQRNCRSIQTTQFGQDDLPEKW